MIIIIVPKHMLMHSGVPAPLFTAEAGEMITRLNVLPSCHLWAHITSCLFGQLLDHDGLDTSIS
jgi:hypothetical protein